MKKLKISNVVTVGRESARIEILRLNQTVGRSFDFNAALWALTRLTEAYEKDFGEKFEFKDGE